MHWPPSRVLSEQRDVGGKRGNLQPLQRLFGSGSGRGDASCCVDECGLRAGRVGVSVI